MVPDRISLDDKYDRREGRIYLNGTQALVRMLLEQRRRDAAAGRNTAGYVTGYRGSPLGQFDQELWRAGTRLTEHRIHFQPGVNEDLAATAVWGTQQLAMFPGARHDGVFALWYGKGPGVDRSGDVFRHANQAGTSPLGGVLALVGDDPGSRSSTVPSQSEVAMVDAEIPLLHPSNVAELIDFGLLGWAMSRYSGCWVAMKAITDVMDCSASIVLEPEEPSIAFPEDFVLPADGVHIRPPEWPPLSQERRLKTAKLPAVRAFARANHLDRAVIDGPERRLGIVTTGKAFGDVMQAIDDLGLGGGRAARAGLSVYKVGLVWPLEPDGIVRFARGLEEILVVEEKRPVIEAQIKDVLYNRSPEERPRIVGEYDEAGEWLVPSAGELNPDLVARAIARRIASFHDGESVRAHLAALDTVEREFRPSVKRVPYFCSGCPHNTSTRVPEGSRAVAGIGCHTMVMWMDRSTDVFTHMGGEGANWIGAAPFSETEHVFVNVGDGTYFHSGLMAIRAAVASGVSITYKVLYNGAVAMTGGQGMDGPLDVPMISRQVAAEGVASVVIVSDSPEHYQGREADLAAGTRIFHRDDLDTAQRTLRKIAGTTVLIYDQTCAAELRRGRKRGEVTDPPKRAFINHLVCEGCGDCGEQSNCVAIVPRDTVFGRKRSVDQASCNKDFSCIKGFCPSFVTVYGKAVGQSAPAIQPLETPPDPEHVPINGPLGIVIAGIGGTGVVTVAAVIGMAAHIDGKAVTVLDQIGLSQKNGAVVSHIRISNRSGNLYASRIATGGAKLMLACDLVTAAGPDVLATMSQGESRAVVDRQPPMTAEFTRDPDSTLPIVDLENSLNRVLGDDAVSNVNAAALAVAHVGDKAAANVLLLGFAWQSGLVPVTAEAIDRAIVLNGVAIDTNRRAFLVGRVAAHDPSVLCLETLGADEQCLPSTPEHLIHGYEAELVAYGGRSVAQRFRNLVDRVHVAEIERCSGEVDLTEAVARSWFKLLAVKDEYEVARLYADGRFTEDLRRHFEGPIRLAFNLAPPLIARRDPRTGQLRKREYGAWVMTVFWLLSRVRFVRGTPFDPFGYTEERREERRIAAEYERCIDKLIARLSPENHGLCTEIAALPLEIRGFGHVKSASVERFDTKRDVLFAALEAETAARSAAE